jgi:hypothetical protein
LKLPGHFSIQEGVDMHTNKFRNGYARRCRNGRYIAPFLFLAIAGAPVECIPAATGEISVQGTAILRDSRPWIPKGVTVVGRVAPASVTRGENFIRAREEFGVQEMERIKEFGADTIRFQVSQGGGDPESIIFSKEYIEEIKGAVNLARSHGFTVILSLQSEKPSGLDELGMPNQKAQRAWNMFAPLFAEDRGVMLELFNEPSPNGPDAVQPHNWDTWRAGMQPLVNVVRKMGAKNVVILDGLYWSQELEGAPPIEDGLAQVIYAVHPYFSVRLRDRPAWDSMFGRFSRNHAVIATEWNAVSFRQNCNADTPAFAANMLGYLHEMRIGLVVWSFDLPRTVFDQNGQLVNFVGFHCGPDTDYSAAALISEYFKR